MLVSEVCTVGLWAFRRGSPVYGPALDTFTRQGQCNEFMTSSLPKAFLLERGLSARERCHTVDTQTGQTTFTALPRVALDPFVNKGRYPGQSEFDAMSISLRTFDTSRQV